MIIINQNSEKISFFIKQKIKKIYSYTLKKFKLENKILNLSFVNIDEITIINNDYRNINKPTDVISNEILVKDYNNPIIGDIFICIDIAKKQAKKYNHSLKREICFLFTHGLLHLLGYDHVNKDDEIIMFKLQEKILSELRIRR